MELVGRIYMGADMALPSFPSQDSFIQVPSRLPSEVVLFVFVHFLGPSLRSFPSRFP
jgi:hypothetical protein